MNPADDGASAVEGLHALRIQAESLARRREALSPFIADSASPEALREALHELQVHQIELEMQNEELRRMHLELDTGRARYFDLYDLAPVGYCTLSEKGMILEANFTAATLLGVNRGALVGQPVSRSAGTSSRQTRTSTTVAANTCWNRAIRSRSNCAW